jgi:putative ABC transport system permease protein
VSNIGITNPAALAPDIHNSVLVEFQHYLGFNGHPTTIWLRARTNKVNAVQGVLAATANPQNLSEVEVSQATAALVAQADAPGAFDDLFVGLGAVALLVGAVGVANVMVTLVPERRSEIGWRRALRVIKGHMTVRFLSGAALLAVIGGAFTAVSSSIEHGAIVIPTIAWTGGIVAAILIGATAGVLPATPAARRSPTEARWTI